MPFSLLEAQVNPEGWGVGGKTCGAWTLYLGFGQPVGGTGVQLVASIDKQDSPSQTAQLMSTADLAQWACAC
jgi:hypothetical protein